MSAEKRFALESIDDITVLHMVDPRLYDTILVNEFEVELAGYVSAGAREIVVDFANVTQCSTAVINALITAQKQVKSAGGEIKLCQMKDMVRQAYRILKLDGSLFHIYEDIDGAVAAFRS